MTPRQSNPGFGEVDAKEEGKLYRIDTIDFTSTETSSSVWLEVSGTPEDFAALRHALTGKKHKFVREVALAAENLSKGKLA